MSDWQPGIVVEANPSDLDVLAGVLAEAFHRLALCVWLIPDHYERTRILPDYFRMVVEHGLQHGVVHTTTDRTGVATWMPRTGGAEPKIPDYQQRLQDMCGRWADRFLQLDAAMESANPLSPPHHQLVYLAVQPSMQRRRIGAGLVRHHISWLDDNRMPAYLLAPGPYARDFYLRLGFCPHDVPIAVADHHKLLPAWRDPIRRWADGPPQAGPRNLDVFAPRPVADPPPDYPGPWPL